MKIDKNSPLLTNYLLGEVTEAERIAVEKAIQTDPEIKSTIENLKPALNLAKSLNTAVEKNTLTEQQKSKILNLAGAASGKNSAFNWKAWSGGVLAASLALVIYINNRSALNSTGAKQNLSALRPNEYSDEGAKSIRAQEKNSVAPKKMATAKASAPTTSGAGGGVATSAASNVGASADSGSIPPELVTENRTHEYEISAADEAPAIIDSAARSAPQDLSKNKKESLDFAPPAPRINSQLAAGSAPAERKASILERGSRLENPFENIFVEILAPEEQRNNPVAVSYFESIIKSCFSGAISRYKKYDEEIEFAWVTKEDGIVSASHIVHKSTGQNFDINLSCVLTSIKNASDEKLAKSNKAQRWRLKLRSK